MWEGKEQGLEKKLLTGHPACVSTTSLICGVRLTIQMLVGSREGNLREGRQHAFATPAGHLVRCCSMTVQADPCEGLGFLLDGGFTLAESRSTSLKTLDPLFLCLWKSSKCHLFIQLQGFYIPGEAPSQFRFIFSVMLTNGIDKPHLQRGC